MLRIRSLTKVWRKDKWRIDCIYWLCKWSQWIATVQSKCSKIPPSNAVNFSIHLAIVCVALVKSSWCYCFMGAALFITRATNSSLLFNFSLSTSLFIHPYRQKSNLYLPTSDSCISTPIENWTHVYVNLFTRNSPYYHLLKYLPFLLKHPVYWLHFSPTMLLLVTIQDLRKVPDIFARY